MKLIKYTVLSLLVVAGFGMQTVSAETSKTETKVELTFGGSGKGFGKDGFSTFENEAPAVPSCKKENNVDCTKELKPYGFKKTNTYAKQCYKYEDKSGKVLDKGCTKSYFVKSAAITSNVSNIYTGIPKNFSCEATFHSFGPKKKSDISKEGKVWSSSLESGKGSGLTVSDSSFFSSNPNNATYKVNCSYNAKKSHPFAFYLTKNSSQSGKTVSSSTKVSNIGVKETRLAVDGCFNEGKGYACGNGDYRHDISTKSYVVGKQKLKAFDQVDFITNHRYNWRAEIQYNDGTDGFGAKSWRDITTSSDVKWSAEPLDYKVPKSGWNTIGFSYLNQESMQKSVSFWSHEVKKITIQKVNTNKLTSSSTEDKESYRAIVTFSDDPSGKFGENNPFSKERGTQEDWTSYVKWHGDEVVKNTSSVTYTFDPFKQLNETRMVKASIGGERTMLSAQMQAAPRATSYNAYWQTRGFSSPTTNFLPPPSVFGHSQTEWTPDISPFYLKGEVNVSGISNGISNR